MKSLKNMKKAALLFLSTTIVFSLITAKGYASSEYNYQFTPNHYPLTEASVVIWDVPVAGGSIPSNLTGDWSKYLLIVLPDQPLTGTVTAKFLKYKGVYVVGGQIKLEGSTYFTPESGDIALPGSDTLIIGFTNNYITSPHYILGTRPFIFVSNIDYDVGDWGNGTDENGLSLKNYWGDFLVAGANSSNNAEWADIYMQKVKVRRGSYFFTAKENASFAPHSDLFQAKTGGWHHLYAANVDYKWYGQGFFIVPSDITGMTIAPLDGRAVLKDINAKPMPPDPLIYKWADPVVGFKRIQHFSQYIGQLDPSSGKYYGVYLDNFNFLKQNSYVNPLGWAPDYFSVKFLDYNTVVGGAGMVRNAYGSNGTPNRVYFDYYKHANHAYPYFSGPNTSQTNLAYVEEKSSESAMPVVVPENEIGLNMRITTAEGLMDIFTPSFKVSKITYRDVYNQPVENLQNGKIKVKIELKNSTTQQKSAAFIVTAKNGDMIEEIKVVNEPVISGPVIITTPDIEMNVNETTTEIKVYVWDSLTGGLTPINVKSDVITALIR